MAQPTTTAQKAFDHVQITCFTFWQYQGVAAEVVAVLYVAPPKG